MRHSGLIALAGLTVLSCCSAVPRATRAPAVSVRLAVTQVPLDPLDPTRQSIGSFAYAGGLDVRGAESTTVFELSDLRIAAGDRLVAISDDGHFFEARLLFDRADQLTGLADAQLTPLIDERGERLTAADGDAEGLELLPTGDRLVSFEGRHRIWRYPADGSAPRSTSRPDAAFRDNEGMEAIARYPAAGPDAYLIGSESGTIWLCGVSPTCTETVYGALVPAGHGLTALSAYGDHGAFAMLGRAYDAVRGARVSVRLIETRGAPAGRVLDELTIAAPLSVDNFEGLAVVPHAAGGIRLYLISDDNGSAAQRTYLLAFDWQPPR